MKYQKYLRQQCSLEAALTGHRRLRRRAEPQPSQHPSASLGQMATLEVLQHRHPSASLGRRSCETSTRTSANDGGSGHYDGTPYRLESF